MTPEKKEKILICSNYAWTVYNFRMPLIRFLRKNGFKVEVLTEFDGYEKKFINEVDGIHSLFISRKGINPFVDLVTILDILIKLFSIKPDFLLLFSIKPVIYGSIAARFFSVPSISMITGLGTGFLLDNWVTRLIKVLYRFALKGSATVFFQNSDDKNLFITHKLIQPEIAKQTPGSGVDLEKFYYRELDKKRETTFLLIARMLWDKGIGEYFDAAKILKNKHKNVNFQLLGPLGVLNRSSINEDIIFSWSKSGIIEYIPETDNIASYIQQSSCVVLPSYREGTSRVLLEAASIGRPIVASNVTGCKEIVEDGFNGYLCEVKNPTDLSKKMEKIILTSYEDRLSMGRKGRRKMEKEFDQRIVFNLYLQIK